MKHIVAVSGGKDSTAMSVRLKELRPNTKFEYVITPTGDELPEMQKHWVMLENLLGGLTRIADTDIFEIIAKHKAIPNFRMRFCTVDLKIKPFKKYMNALSPDSVMYVGLRADEPGRLGILDTDINIEYPMRSWGWDINKVNGYLAGKGIVIPERTDCGMCFFQRLPEWKALLENHPERYEKYVQIEKQYGHTFRSPQRDTWPAALDDLRSEFLSGRKLRKSNPRGTKKCRFCSM